MATYFIPRKEKFSSVLKKGTYWEGTLFFDNSLFLEDKFKGELFTEGLLHIGIDASFEGNIYAKDVIISGEFKGNLFAYSRLEIEKTASVSGSIKTFELKVDDGSFFDCYCQPCTQEELENEFFALKEKALSSHLAKSQPPTKKSEKKNEGKTQKKAKERTPVSKKES